jgi:hypothetical protein
MTLNCAKTRIKISYTKPGNDDRIWGYEVPDGKSMSDALNEILEEAPGAKFERVELFELTQKNIKTFYI